LDQGRGGPPEQDVTAVALNIALAFGVRLLLVMLFLPFSALDKILDFEGAVAQARQVAASRPVAVILVGLGLCVEIGMSAAILIGVADRAAALTLALYCVATAVLWKPFWRPGDFRAAPHGRARTLFWDFWKNLALAGGFLLLTFGPTAGSADGFFAAPLGSTHPYSQVTAP
jgi:putative oxidoreductase